jgi:hypothetical protein
MPKLIKASRLRGGDWMAFSDGGSIFIIREIWSVVAVKAGDPLERMGNIFSSPLSIRLSL